jgi:hypothetical protein
MHVGDNEGQRPLSDILAGRDGALLKFDIEGAEYEMLSRHDVSHMGA